MLGLRWTSRPPNAHDQVLQHLTCGNSFSEAAGSWLAAVLQAGSRRICGPLSTCYENAMQVGTRVKRLICSTSRSMRRALLLAMRRTTCWRQ